MKKTSIPLAALILASGGPVAADAGVGAISAIGSAPLAKCDESLRATFQADALTRVVLVKPFKKGEALTLSGTATDQTPRAQNDLCLVKLIVGPGNPGPADAPSTSPGIGIEVWLPAASNWNERLHVLGGGGWDGGSHGSPAAVAEPRAAAIAGTEGAVSSHSDGGHPRPGGMPGQVAGGGDFAMNPDGSLNHTLLADFASRSMHEQAVKAKALAAAYYGRAPKYSYWDGASNGGRQGLNIAQNHPDDFDGILADMPAINWTSFLLSDVYPQLVFQRDLHGKVPSEAQQDLVSNAAIKACDVVGGEHLGYIMDIGACRYDPAKDAAVLCEGDGGKNTTPNCVTKVQALAFNKIWYGPTTDGSAPSPSVDNGWNGRLNGKRRWYGFPRGTSLYNAMFSRLFRTNAGVANVTGPFTHATDGLALVLKDPKMASTNFRNAAGDGVDGWKALSYAQFAQAFDRAQTLRTELGTLDSNNPDLGAFKRSGGKMMTWHGVHDEAIPVQGSMHYYDAVVAKMGGLAQVQEFYKLYIVPGVGHATPNGTANPSATPPVVDNQKYYRLLVDWVEKGIEPGRINLDAPPSAPVKTSQPICPYPQKAVFRNGNPRSAASYDCR